jgi:hypothetical protein
LYFVGVLCRYSYANASFTDFNTLDTDEVSSANPQVADRMFEQLMDMIA